MLPTLLSLSSSTQGLGVVVERESSTPPTCRVLLGSPPPGNPLGPLEPSLCMPAALMTSCLGAKLGYLQRRPLWGHTAVSRCRDSHLFIPHRERQSWALVFPAPWGQPEGLGRMGGGTGDEGKGGTRQHVVLEGAPSGCNDGKLEGRQTQSDWTGLIQPAWGEGI